MKETCASDQIRKETRYEKYILESCVDSVESALAAAKGGADRLELCANLIIGGTTPSPALFEEIRKVSTIRMHAMIRPRFGDFCYTDYEFAIIRREVAMYREMGAEGVVIGCLNPDGSLNMEQMETLMKEAGGMSVTLHRAFDVCRDPFEALDQAKKLGIHTILTSRAEEQRQCRQRAAEGAHRARRGRHRHYGWRRCKRSGDPGAGALYRGSCLPYVRKITLDSQMEYRREGVNMGLPSLSEFEIWRTKAENIRAAREVLDSL